MNINWLIFFLNLDNRLIDSYAIVLVRCTEQEDKITLLRQEKNDLEKKIAGTGDVPGDARNSTLLADYMKVKDENLSLYRERGDVNRNLKNKLIIYFFFYLN